MNNKQLFAVSLSVLAISQAIHAEEVMLTEVVVNAEKLQPLPSNSKVNKDGLTRSRTHTSDSAKLLEDQPGVSLYGAGGVSSLPAIHGLADDRVHVTVDGMDLISACANHMNSPLSYIDPANVGSVKVYAGISPVSQGGDSIAGTIQVDSPAPEFAKTEETLLKGQASVFYRSNNRAQGANLSATIAGENISMRYTGATVRAGNYSAAQNFKAAGIATGTREFLAANEVGSSKYQSDNHALAFGLQKENHLLELKLGLQNIPYQGFPTQRMDMLKNDSQQINLNYSGAYAWGKLQARAYHEHTEHYMNFLEYKLQTSNPAGMPMDTDGKNTGFTLKGDVFLSERDTLRVGVESQRYRMSDGWNSIGPWVTGAPQLSMKGDGPFMNINNGQRDRLAVFGEWEADWSPQWLSQLGLRSEAVQMNTGTVQGYSTQSYAPSSYAAFNAMNRRRNDSNIDITALSRYTPDERKTFEFGIAQKTRSPNLYERFAWSGSNTMVMNMNNWVGDGNGYVGNVDLKPEVAHTLSVSGNWHDAEEWNLKFAPYYTHVQNYIDAVLCSTTATHGCPTPRTDGFANLSLANQTARLYGADVSGKMSLLSASAYGSFSATGGLNYVNGKNLTTGANLYNIMPMNLKLAVEQHSGNWTNTIEARLVEAKTEVEAVRKELKTGGYGLLNLYSSYAWKQMRIDLGVENLLNKFYANPLGGAYVGQGNTMSTGAPYGIAVPGMGRSLNAGMTVKF
jgi:iron complex outermembrane recepter protein